MKSLTSVVAQASWIREVLHLTSMIAPEPFVIQVQKCTNSINMGNPKGLSLGEFT